MLVDYFLDRDRACHRGLLPQQRGRSTERVTGDIPQRVKQRRPHPPLSQQCLEPGEMALLGLGHRPNRPRRMAASEHIQLPFINAGRAILAGMIDAQHARELLIGGTVARQAMSRSFAHAVPQRNPARSRSLRDCRKAARQQPIMIKDASRFQPASEMPHSDHAGSSQRTGC